MEIKRKIRFLRTLTPSGVVTLIRQKLTGKEYFISGTCHQCGCCCKLINLKYHKGWIQTESQFDELISTNPEYARFKIVSDKLGYLQFTCSWLDNLDGCIDYERRLDICKRYPTKSLLLCGGKLLNDCGYSIDEVKPFKKYLFNEMKKKQKK